MTYQQVIVNVDECYEDLYDNSRSTFLEMFCEKGVLKNFAKFTGKHLCQSLFFNNVSAMRSANLLEK